MTTIALIRIKGQVCNHPKRTVALNLLGLTKKYSVAFLPDSPFLKGQLKLLQPNLTWGEANDDITATLAKKYPSQKIYHLNPPHGGLGRKGIKTPYRKKGAYGYRGDAINALLKKMM